MLWRVRSEGGSIRVASSARAVLEGIRDGDWEVTDDVRGPRDNDWVPIENHPLFAEACAEAEIPRPEHPDETRLDMNPLIDVSLVLLIFFILTATYSSLRRTIDLPPEPQDDGKSKAQVVKSENFKERTFKVIITMKEAGEPNILIDNRPSNVTDLEHDLIEVARSTRKNELIADVADDVPWGIEAKLFDAAKGAEIKQIYYLPKRR